MTYTREVQTKTSELVDEVYYNENNGDLYVDLDTAVYKYSNVPVTVVDDFEKADSAGSFYGTVIKRKFGPGENLGSWTGIEYNEVPKAVALNTGGVISVPAGLTYGGSVNVAKGEYAHARSGLAEALAADSDKVFSLKPFTDEPVKVEGVEREYIVTFEVDGIVDFKRHTLKANSVDEAVNSVLDLGKMLDLHFVVREVCIRFE